VHTTPPPPFDVAAALPPVAPYARTTVRLHPRPGAPTAAQSSMGGPLLWPAEEPWPACDGPAGAEHLDGAEVVPRPAMAGWGFDTAADHPWRRLQNPAGIILGDAGGIYLFVCLACPGRPYEYRFDCS
jgi:hypothetical protein